MFDSLRTRLLLAVGLLAVTSVGAIALSARYGTRVEFGKFQQITHTRSLEHAAERAARIASQLEGACCSAGAMSRAAAGLNTDEALIAVDEEGRLLEAAGPAASFLRSARTRKEGDALIISDDRTVGERSRNRTLRLRALPAPRVAKSDGGSAYIYVVPVPAGPAMAKPEALFLGSVDQRLLLAGGFVGVLAVGFAYAIARRILGPIGELDSAARDLARGNLSRRVVTRGSDELATLGRSFNAMASELERQQVLRRHLVQDVSHELRTPLAALQCRLETMQDGLSPDPRQSLQDAADEVRHLAQLIDDLHEIAVAEARELKLSIADVAVADLVHSAARAVELDKEPTFRMDVDPALKARADAVRTRQILINLLTNARRHAPPAAEISARATLIGAEVLVEVRNTGSALDDRQLARLFDRFYRGDPARQRSTGGTGLGLAIVKHLVEAQGGCVGAVSDAEGVTVRFTLPAP
jgi:signal transduction histidine kinase